jgi:hypothetical protein
VLFFFSGLHGDYHKPSDTWDKINAKGAARLLDMVAATAGGILSAGVDGITIQRYQQDVEANLERLARQLQDGSYHPKPIRRTYIPKADGKLRPLGIPTVQDRIVQGALRQVIEPIFEREFARHSYGFRPGKGCKDALRRVEELLKAGYRFDKGRKWPRDKSKQKLRERLKPYLQRTSGVSLQTIIAKINPSLRGWFGYFKHADRRGLYDIDRWVRTRLRSILRKRHGGQGKGRGDDHHRWPNHYFADLGLFSLEQAHRAACRSMKMAH